VSAAAKAGGKARAKPAVKAGPAPKAKSVPKKPATKGRQPAKPAVAKQPVPKRTASGVKPVREPELQEVTFTFCVERGSEVFVAGTFNDWDATRNRLVWRDGAYAVTLKLAKGRYEYKMVVNGTWCMDPECPDWVPNGFGSLNSVIVVE